MKGGFEARIGGVYRDGSVLLVGFAESQFGATRYLNLARDLEPAEQDVALGQDGVHLEIDDQYYSDYGVVEAVELRATSVSVHLLPSFASERDVAEAFVVGLTSAEFDADAVAAGLTELLGGRFRDARTA